MRQGFTTDLGDESGKTRSADLLALHWSVRPVTQEPAAKTGALIAAIVLLSIAVGYSFEAIRYALLSLVVLIASMSRYWLATRYEIDAGGVQTECFGRRERRSWREFRRIELRGDGVFLSPFPHPSRLDSFRGLMVRCPQNRDAVAEFARRQVGMQATRR